jgi:Flp pilus assembly protein TadD
MNRGNTVNHNVNRPVKRMSMLKLTTSAMVLGTTMVGCGMTGQAQRPSNVSDARAAKIGATAAAEASKALAKKKIDKAVVLAEAAVAAQPRNAGYRMLLGQVYLASGRFQSAEQSFADTLTLDPERERAALNLALAQVALGKKEAARSTLADYRDKLPAADMGLALALAGDADEAVRILEFATRAPDATAKTRQNLALAYALQGKWANAKVMAVQDLTPDETNTRLAQWAAMVRPTGAADQVASLLGVKPQADAGQPTRLALSPASPAVAVAQLSPVAAELPVLVTPAQPETVTVVASDVAPAFETVANAVPSVEAPTPKPALMLVQPIPVAPKATSQPRQAPRSAGFVRTAAVPRAAGGFRPASAAIGATDGKFVVQLGAFRNAVAAERAWNRIAGRVDLANYGAINGSVKRNQASLVRVSVGGFGSRDDANAMCARIKQTGNVCFVRIQASDAPARWVQRHTFKVAAR